MRSKSNGVVGRQDADGRQGQTPKSKCVEKRVRWESKYALLLLQPNGQQQNDPVCSSCSLLLLFDYVIVDFGRKSEEINDQRTPTVKRWRWSSECSNNELRNAVVVIVWPIVIA